MWEGIDELYHALALLDLDFSILDSSDLFINEAIKQAVQSLPHFLQLIGEEVLIRIIDLGELAVDGI